MVEDESTLGLAPFRPGAACYTNFNFPLLACLVQYLVVVPVILPQDRVVSRWRLVEIDKGDVLRLKH